MKVTVVDRSKTTVPFIIQGTATTEHESFSYKVKVASHLRFIYTERSEHKSDVAFG